jgi:hypothetical protein
MTALSNLIHNAAAIGFPAGGQVAPPANAADSQGLIFTTQQQ